MDLAGLVLFILAIAVIGFLVYVIITYVKMPELFQQVIILVTVVFIVIYILGLITGHASLPKLS